jgi:hypothetical protein
VSALNALCNESRIEHNQIYTILTKYSITGYFRFVDDILILEKSRTRIDEALSEYNTIHPSIKFTL